MTISRLLVAVLLVAACGSDDRPKAEGPTTNDTGGAGGGGGGVVACDVLGTPLAQGTAPKERGDMAFAADPACGRVYMFYGDEALPENCGPAASKFLNDAFVFDANYQVWSQIEIPGPAPLARARGRAVWDEKRGRVILFGGRWRAGSSGAYEFPNDVWAFDPAAMSWQELSAEGAPGAPSGRMNMTFVADPDRDRVIVHAGGKVDASFTKFIVDSDTFAFDLEAGTWSQIATGGTQPPPRIFHASAFDRAGGRLVVVGGGGEDAFTAPKFMRDTWALDVVTGTWTEIGGAGPEGRIKAEMIYDEAGGRLVLFAGHDDTQLGNNNDVWTLDLAGLTWTRQLEGDTFNKPADGFCDFPADFAKIDKGSPERRESHLFERYGKRAIMYGGRTDCGLARDTWQLDLGSLTWTQLNESASGMTCYRSGSLQCDEPGARMCI